MKPHYLDDKKWARTGGALIFVSGLIFVLFNTIAEAIYPNYNVGSQALSALGAIGTNTRYLWDGQLFVSGSLSLIGTVLFFYRSQCFEIPRRRVTSVMFVLPSLGSIIVSLVPENLNIGIHTIGAFITFVVGGIVAIYSARFLRSPFRYFSIILGVITLVFITQLQGSYIGFGGTERLVVYPVVLWEIGFGTILMEQK